MNYEVVRCKKHEYNCWQVEAINHPPEGEGEIYITIFEGLEAKERADEYAEWKNT